MRLRGWYERAVSAVAVCFVLAAVGSLVCLLLVAPYNRMQADDFAMSWGVHAVAGDGLFAIFGEMFKMVRRLYFGWQGTFSAIALMAAHPCAIFGWNAAWLVPVVMSASLALATALVLKRVTGGFGMAAALAAPILFLSLNWLPSAVEAFFWYNGAVFYTFYYAASLVFVFLLTSGKKAAAFAAIPLGLFVGGGNYVSALTAALLAGLCAIIFIVGRAGAARIAAAVASFLAVLTSLLISGLAPGNAVRAEALTQLSPPSAIALSLVRAAKDIASWTTPTVTLALLLSLPLMWRAASKSPLRFRRAPLVAAASFLLFAAQNASSFYAQGWEGPGRLRDIVYFSYVLLMFLNCFYIVGAIRMRAGTLPRLGSAAKLPLLLALGAAFAFVLFTSRGEAASVAALRDYTSGDAVKYAEELDSRHMILTESKAEREALPALAVRPASLYFDDLTENPEDWRNAAAAKYYGKQSIVVN